ncbi:MAG TPA: hypothetical protein P5235_08015 [Saprospiraceae bacterium]|nr:hypothetical protein [Saprospiraceae bacterium]MCB9328659.1 hypothetical protein [Lewinellaceae bacterium]HRX29319.1 hypothetical protein [Saprospiraceae bacterium]
MKEFLIISILTIFLLTSCSSQNRTINAVEIELTNELVDSLVYQEDCGNELKMRIANNLHLIHQFNGIKQILGQTDIIRVFKVNNSYLAYYRDKELEITKTYIDEEKLIKIWGSKAHTVNFIFSETFNGNGTSQRIILSSSKLNSDKSSIKVENYINGVISGSYKELKLNGEPIVIGNFTQIDSIYHDTIITYDYETYEEQFKVIKRLQIGIKCGEWMHYNNDGQIKIEKQKINCMY